MPVFANREDFISLGLEQIEPSTVQAPQDCTVCLDPLDIHFSHTANPSPQLHPAVRVFRCGHILGQECLEAWLSVGNTCPSCNCLLFEASEETFMPHYAYQMLYELDDEQREALRQLHPAVLADLLWTEALARDDEHFSPEYEVFGSEIMDHSDYHRRGDYHHDGDIYEEDGYEYDDDDEDLDDQDLYDQGPPSFMYDQDISQGTMEDASEYYSGYSEQDAAEIDQ